MVDVRYLSVNLRHFRHHRRLSQIRLAELVRAAVDCKGFSQSYISSLERGLLPAREEHVAALAAVLQVPTSALVTKPKASAARPAFMEGTA